MKEDAYGVEPQSIRCRTANAAKSTTASSAFKDSEFANLFRVSRQLLERH